MNDGGEEAKNEEPSAIEVEVLEPSTIEVEVVVTEDRPTENEDNENQQRHLKYRIRCRRRMPQKTNQLKLR